ncbi:BNR-4 repeat-containing protein [Agrobacterium tumefaciens]|uniref:BNR-4 repeat-containing protein n=1 Tax=Agrobacterium tumefaciens TaxID=358 RepID=UPI0015748C10|nr:BNR-4 repeat-containing protein [Agrobacterium tumefaciens]NSY51299.1 hypothetical protein [Agrobacterium tumefaciens]NTD86711.1 hypothetical protein [Agrobacterium tumefaciens]NTD93956.1 hypothetical protein [Agrobacterium tumefaciens]NTE11396.1 hypothetical protein [Agrobacterium tumefaciens]NTE27496.1 hypothetical protein [Agrobacterium tumefaciens]
MMRMLSLKSWLLAGAVLLHAVSYSHADAPVCGPGAAVPVGGGRNGIEIDEAWSGVTVTFDAIARRGKIYFGYYNADRWLTVAQLDQNSGVVCRSRLPSQFAGWDGHNTVALAFDASGHIHIAGNMHASPLVYGASSISESIAKIVLSPMVGSDEENVTYPSFITGPDHKLYFAYRSGFSGNGEWIVNAREGGAWKRVPKEPIFSSSFEGRPTNAYPSSFRFLNDYVHIAAVWRRTSDVSSNYAITYARTRDFLHWEDHNGQEVKLPMSPETSDMVELTGEREGLVNGARVAVTASGKPVVAYAKYGPSGRNSIVLASPLRDRWHHSFVAMADQRTLVAGSGSVPHLPTIGELDVNKGPLGTVNFKFPGETRRQVYFDVDTLNPTEAPEALSGNKPNRPALVISPPGLIDGQRNAREIRDYDDPNKTVGSIIYFSQGVNGDKPRKCTLEQPTACNPYPSPLIFAPL